MDVYLLNESASVSQDEAWRIAWALDYQARYHLGRSGWRQDVRCIYLPPGHAVPAGGSVLHLLDTSDQPGALGYHDEDGSEIPFARVFVQTTVQDGQQPSAVASHELLELVVDPHINLSALTGDGSRLYALEVGDPVQGTDYDVGLLEGRVTGVTVANFALPAYFDPNTKAERVDFRGTLSAPFTVGPQGYMSYLDMRNPGAGWQQQLGAERSAPPAPDADDRLQRRAVAL